MGKYNSYTAGFKLKVIAFAEQHGNRAAERQFSVSEKLVRGWRKIKDKLKDTNVSRRAFRGAKCGKYPEVDVDVCNYVEKVRNNGFCVTYDMIQCKAREVARNKNIPEELFQGSRGWALRFMRRHNLSVRRRTSICQKLPADYTEKVVQFHRFVLRKRQARLYELSQIGNADQTPVCFDMPRNTSIAKKGSSTVTVRTTGNERLRCTVMLAVTADGNKLPPYVIFKRKTMPKGLQLPRGILVSVQSKGWMDSEHMVKWVKSVWNRRPGALLKRSALLVMDSFRGHTTDEVKQLFQENNTEQIIIPGGLTSILQPLDVCLNKPFKDNLRSLYADWIASGNHQLTPTGKIKRPSIELLCTWIMTSWDSVKMESVRNSFKKTGISNALDGSEDDALWNNDCTLSDTEEISSLSADSSSTDERESSDTEN